MSVAVTSLPVPLSPVTSTVLSLLPMTRRNSNTARIRALRPTTTESMAATVGVVIASPQPEGLELGHLLAQRRLDAEIEGHVRAGTAGAHAGQPHSGRIALDLQQLDVAAVGLHEGTHPREHRFDAFFGNHARTRRNRRATGRRAGFPVIPDVIAAADAQGADYSPRCGKIRASGGLSSVNVRAGRRPSRDPPAGAFRTTTCPGRTRR